MKALLSKHFWYSNCGTAEYFKSMENFKKNFAGKWVDIDTSYLFADQYNTTESSGNARIHDSDIVRVVDDARNLSIYTCPYCGKQGVFEDIKKHKEDAANRLKHCSSCPSWGFVRDENTPYKFEESEEKIEQSEEGYTRVDIRKTYTKYIPGCTAWHCKYQGCSEAEPKLAFEYCYFLEHPYGNLFDNFKPNFGEIKGDVFIYHEKTYTIEFNMNTYRLKAYNNRRTFETTMEKEFYGNMAFFKFLIIKDQPDVLNRILYNVRYRIDDLISDIRNYNERVSEDWRYINPDGSRLDSITVDGKVIKRPTPVYWKVINKEESNE